MCVKVRLLGCLLAVLLSTGLARAQAAPPTAERRMPPPGRSDTLINDQNDLASAPIPADVHELVSGRVETPATPKDISAAFALLDRARRSMNLYAPDVSYSMKISFTASGPLSGGAGSLEEIKGMGIQERWSVHLGDYSLVRVNGRGGAYDDRPPGQIPLRIQMLRAAIFWPFSNVRPQEHLRIAKAEWNGKQVDCVLLSEATQTAPIMRGRSWREKEYCVDIKSGLLQIYSEAPGIYTVYDFQKPIQFQSLTLERGVTVFEGGARVLDAHLDAIGPLDPAGNDPFAVNGNSEERGPVLSIPMHLYTIPHLMAGFTLHGTVEKVKPIMVHASFSDNGEVLEAEVLQDPGSELSKLALEYVKTSQIGRPQGRDPAPRQWEMFAEVDIVP